MSYPYGDAKGPFLTLLPTDWTTRIFRAFVQCLRDDPILRGQGVAFWAWEGDRLQVKNGSAAFLPTPDQVRSGLLRITPATSAAKRETEGQHMTTLVMEIEAFTPGTHLDDSMNLCGAVYAAAFSPSTVAAMNATGAPIAGRPTMTQAGIGTAAQGESIFALARKMAFAVRLLY